MIPAAEAMLELAEVRLALAQAYARQGEHADAGRHAAAARFYFRCADEHELAERGAAGAPQLERGQG